MYLIQYEYYKKKQYFNCQDFSLSRILKSLLKKGKNILEIKKLEEINITQELEYLSNIQFLDNIPFSYLIEYNHCGILKCFECTAPALKLALNTIESNFYNEILKIYKQTIIDCSYKT